MDGNTEHAKKRRRGSVEGEEAEGAAPPKVKQEERSDADKNVVDKRHAEPRRQITRPGESTAGERGRRLQQEHGSIVL